MKNIFKMLLVSVVAFMFAACDTDVETKYPVKLTDPARTPEYYEASDGLVTG